MGAMNQIEEEKSKLHEKTMSLEANLEVSSTAAPLVSKKGKGVRWMSCT